MKCKYCGGDAGEIINGAHTLCAYLNSFGLPTPCIGKKCKACNGAGATMNGRVLINPSQRAINACSCKVCNGKGYI